MNFAVTGTFFATNPLETKNSGRLPGRCFYHETR